MTTFNPNFVIPKGLVPCDAASFAKDAVDLAKFLLDKYLFCPQSAVGYVRIIETEAYPVDDKVYSYIFGKDETQQALPDRAGVLFRMSSRLHMKPVRSGGVEFPDYLYVTAKGSSEAGALRPVVLIRSCVPHFCESLTFKRNPAVRSYLEYQGYDDKARQNNGLKYLLINPHMVAKVLEPDFKSSPPSDPVLYAGVGCRLYSWTDPQDPVFGPVLWGKRVLEIRRKLLGLASTFRFLLATDIPRWRFKESDDLVLMPVSSEDPPPALAGPSQVVMDPQQMVMGPQWVPMGPPQVPVYQQEYVPMGPPHAPMDPPAPVFHHYGPSQVVMDPQQMVMDPQLMVMDSQQMVMDSQQMVMDSQRMVMDPQQMVMGPQGILMSPPQVPVSAHQEYVPLGPPQAPMGPPAPEFPHYWPQ